MEGMVKVMSTVWCGSCTAKWSMAEVADWEIGLKEGERVWVRQLKL